LERGGTSVFLPLCKGEIKRGLEEKKLSKLSKISIKGKISIESKISKISMSKDKEKVELLAPAGNLEKLKTAFAYGADAVYLGAADFSLRVRINQFNLGRIRQAVNYAHKRNKKVYLTLNIFAHNRDLKKIPGHIKKLQEIGADALIASDPGIISLIKKEWPGAEIHLSTQANCLNWEAVRFWKQNGVKRIILGREVTLEDIKEIKKKVPDMELEYFVHGAMCMAYSGRCFLSQYFLGRSANLGDCVQPCRWRYFISEEKRPENPLEIEEDKRGSYILNSRDLCLIDYLDKLKKAGVDSFKIEGRNKSVYYLANVCGAYRQALDYAGLERKEEIKRLKKELEEKLVNRGYTTGFLLGETAEQNIGNSHIDSDWEFCGQVVKSYPEGKTEVKVHNSLKRGELVEIIKPFYNVLRIKVDKIINARNGQEMTEAHGGGSGDVVLLDIGEEVSEYCVLRRKVC